MTISIHCIGTQNLIVLIPTHIPCLSLLSRYTLSYFVVIIIFIFPFTIIVVFVFILPFTIVVPFFIFIIFILIILHFSIFQLCRQSTILLGFIFKVIFRLLGNECVSILLAHFVIFGTFIFVNGIALFILNLLSSIIKTLLTLRTARVTSRGYVHESPFASAGYEEGCSTSFACPSIQSRFLFFVGDNKSPVWLCFVPVIGILCPNNSGKSDHNRNKGKPSDSFHASTSTFRS
mmetsp:Transcript_36815/g.37104  ORF Transcript_36815/g.37104 Transcript_36815/m.37104 type:complete len:233 (-) Transcript_36815:411-1109(-)